MASVTGLEIVKGAFGILGVYQPNETPEQYLARLKQ